MLRPFALPLALLSVAACGLAFAASTARPQEDAAAPAAAANDDGELTDDERHERLQEAMNQIQASFKRLRRVMRKPEMKADALDACKDMEAAILETLRYVPVPEKPLEGADLLAFELDYKRRMASVYVAVLDMQEALEKGDADRVKELYKGLGKHKKEGHDLYIPQEK